jgi:hypothetical protein
MAVTTNNHVNTAERELKGNVGKNTEGRSIQLQQEMKEINPWDLVM